MDRARESCASGRKLKDSECIKSAASAWECAADAAEDGRAGGAWEWAAVAAEEQGADGW